MATQAKETQAKEPKDKQDKLSVKNDPRALQFRTIFEGDQFQKALTATLPRHISPARMIRVVLSAMQGAPKLLECTPNSVLLSIMRAASMGLEPDGGPLGQGYLVPYWNGKLKCRECQFIPGYRGLVKLARNSGEVADVWAEVVFEKDTFSYSLGLNPTLEHVRDDGKDDPGEMTHAYAVARFRDGERKFNALNRREVEQIRDTSASKDKDGKLVGPWLDWPGEMWKKTAVRRLAKLLPLSVENQAVFASDLGAVNPTQAAIQAFPLLSLPEAETVDSTPEPAIDAEPEQEGGEPIDSVRGLRTRLAKCKTAEEVNAVKAEMVAAKLFDAVKICDERISEIGK